MDTKIFFLINYLPHSAFLNGIALFLHIITYGGLMYYPIIIALFYLKKPLAKPAAITLISTYFVSDIILKNLIHRPRPPQILQNVINPGLVPHNFSFPSGQTAVAFAFAFLIIFMYPKKIVGYIFLLFSLLVGFSRMYLGHHFPSDVLSGAILGILISYIIYKIFSKIAVKKILS
jgi:undecaprenyl-diphosphatase